jgi:hypothetical protein
VTSLLAAGCATALPAPAPHPAPAPARPAVRAMTPLGVELTWDARARTFEVADRPGTYWLDGHFFRQDGGNWQTSETLDGPWSACPPAALPPGLRPAR